MNRTNRTEYGTGHGKKRGLCACLLALSLALAAGAAAERTVVATFYPIWVLTAAAADGIPDTEVLCMAPQTAGCLHDYSLTAGDAAMIERADALVVCGGGMEAFLDRIRAMRPDLPVIDSSAGIDLLPGWEEGAMNAHVWLAPKLAARQAETIAAGLAALDPDGAGRYAENAAALSRRLSALDAELAETLSGAAGGRIVTFHEAFSYLAAAYGIEVAGVIAHEPGEAPSPRELAETCDLVRRLGIPALFTEPQYPAAAAEIVARETGAEIRSLDPFVSGDGTIEGYERTMRENARIIAEALAP